MTELFRMFKYEFGAASLLASLMVIVGLSVWLIISANKENGDGVEQSDVDANISIVEITTKGEQHEYLFYREVYRGSLCHLPNCRFCKDASK